MRWATKWMIVGRTEKDGQCCGDGLLHWDVDTGQSFRFVYTDEKPSCTEYHFETNNRRWRWLDGESDAMGFSIPVFFDDAPRWVSDGNIIYGWMETR